jgi:hypothetical protein
MQKIDRLIRNKLFQRSVLFFFSAITFIAYTLFCWCFETIMRSDDLTLFNPVYTFLLTGHLHYPIYGSDTLITVHPPVHYYFVAFLMKAGLSSQIAYTTPFLLSLLLLLIVNFLSNLSFVTKMAIVSSLHLWYLFPINSIRPDCTLALLWFTSWFLFEWALVKKKNLMLPFLAAFVLALSSVYHYYGFFGLFGVLVYLFKYLRAKDWKNFWATILGLVLVLVPFYSFFVFPHFQEILHNIGANQGDGGIADAWRRHTDFYLALETGFGTFYLFSPLIAALFLSYHFHLVLTILALIILLARPSTRRLGFAFAPLLLAILFFSRGKTEGYLLPEFLAFMFGVSSVLFEIVRNLFNRKNVFAKISALVIAFTIPDASVINIAFAVALVSKPATFQQHVMHLERKCAQLLLGSAPNVAGRISAWYISGATQWHDLNNDIMRPGLLPPKDSLIQYFSKYDAIAETKHTANATSNANYATINTLYLDSTLQLKSFIFSDNGGYDSEMACAFYAAVKPKTFAAFLITQGYKVNKAIEDSSGDMIFVSAKIDRKICLVDSIISKAPNILALNYFPLPDSVSGKKDHLYRDVTQDIGFFIVPLKEYKASEPYLKSHMQIRDTHICKVERFEIGLINERELIQPIQYFY